MRDRKCSKSEVTATLHDILICKGVSIDVNGSSSSYVFRHEGHDSCLLLLEGFFKLSNGKSSDGCLRLYGQSILD